MRPACRSRSTCSWRRSRQASVGILIGLPALRMRGLYLALITLMAAAGFQILVTGTQFPNGGTGVLGVAVNSVFMPRPFLGRSDDGDAALCLRDRRPRFLLIERRTAADALGGPGRSSARAKPAPWRPGSMSPSTRRGASRSPASSRASPAGCSPAPSACSMRRPFPASESVLLFALTVVGGAYSWVGPDPYRDCCFGRRPPFSTTSASTAISLMSFSAPACCMRSSPRRAASPDSCSISWRHGGQAWPETRMIAIREVSVSFGGVHGAQQSQAELERPRRRHHRPQRSGQDDAAQCLQRLRPVAIGRIRPSGPTYSPCHRTGGRAGAYGARSRPSRSSTI